MNKTTKLKKPPLFFARPLNLIPIVASSIAVLGLWDAPAQALKLTPIGRYKSADGVAEISAYDPVSQQLFVTNSSINTIDVLSLSNPSNPSKISAISLGNVGTVNSVAFKNGILAAAVDNVNPQANGSVLFFDKDGNLVHQSTVGAIPDMVTFTPDGRFVIVANEGEPNDDYTNDPLGSVSIIDTANNYSVTTVGFENVPIGSSVRIFGPGATPAQDLEPEYIAVSADSSRAWITLQENNAIAILNLITGEFEEVVGLGFKDHSLPGNGLDASDRDGKIDIKTHDKVLGMFQPDAIGAYSYNGETYLVTANEGDARDYDGFSEEDRVRDLTLDPTAFPNAKDLQKNGNLGRLTVTNTLGDTDGDGDFDELYAFGARSFSIWDFQGNLIFDSGDAFEQITADLLPDFFNADEDNEGLFDNRSDNKGPEPEGLVLGKIGNRTLAFIGLERIGGVMLYDVTNPFNPLFLDYVNPRDFLASSSEEAGDLAPEGLLFIDKANSPNGKPLLVVTNEVSGTTTIYEVVPEPSMILGALTAAGFLLGNKRRKKVN
ncbi:alkaline phosphatase-like protein [Gloeothece citriformis PCC 7424]|uniref:Alkaline phosphatase-like protein n=1 Tax=Gloeothece citriformis (strain PCC 7424) TaxID=65393 RepID=B7KDV1_GLOC7|nr:choice-of-anchor I family protein [Gloeothece citriformis]ACK70403.1 alkaline phosphatase-like protein [Gloeothece citriformis PCC 7424]